MDDVTKALFRAKTADEVRDLIAKGADIKARDDSEKTPLFFQWRPDVARALIEAGCDVHARDEIEWTALHCVSNVELIPMLVKAGADINAQDAEGMTPLMACIDLDHDENPAPLVAALLEAGADTTLIYHGNKEERQTALDIAKWKVERDPSVSEALRLLQAKVDRDALNADVTLERIKESKPATPK